MIRPGLSRQAGLWRGLCFAYDATRAGRVAWTRAGPVLGVLKAATTTFRPSKRGWCVDDGGNGAGGLEFPRTRLTAGIHPSQPVGVPVSMEVLFVMDSFAGTRMIATTSNNPSVYNGCTLRTGNGDLQVNLGSGAGGTSPHRRTWELNGAPCVVGAVHHLIFSVYSFTEAIFLFDGQELLPGSASGSTSSPNTPRTDGGYQILGDGENNDGAADGRVYLLHVWDRLLTRAEMRTRYADPFGLMAPDLLRAGPSAPPASGGQAPVIAAVAM